MGLSDEDMSADEKTTNTPQLSESKEEKDAGSSHNGTENGKRKRGKIHRRSRWACDDCRGRKIKCDGQRPCGPCRLAHQECTYTFQRKSKYSGPLHIQELEEKCRILEAETRKMSIALKNNFPNIDLESSDLTETIRNHVSEISNKDFSIRRQSTNMQQISKTPERPSPPIANQGELLDTMITAAGLLSIDEEGHCQYQGDFAGLAFLQQIDERCSQLLGVNRPKKQPFDRTPLQQAFGSGSSIRRPFTDSMIKFDLPSKETALYLTGYALRNGFSLMDFIYEPTFNNLLARIYDTKPENYSVEELSFLPLLYVVLAIGKLFSGSNGDFTPTGSLDQMKGVKWFRAGQSLIDTANCRNLYSLQALVGIIIYLQSSALMHSCYSYISAAISVSLQMGLHRSDASPNLSPIEQETRRRIFWIIQTMEVYVSTLLGLPTVLEDEDINQGLPLCVERVFKGHENGAGPSALGLRCPVASLVAHIKLLKIQRRIVKEIYQRTLMRGKRGAYRVNYASVMSFEAELDEWFEGIPLPSHEESDEPEILRTQLLLRLAYAHVQMVLYRPFIIHVVRTQLSEMRAFACASACIKAAMQIVWLVEQLEDRGLLISAYWFTVYIIFFAVMALCMFIISNPDDPTADDALAAAEKGKRILSTLATESLPAEKCVASLGTLFDKISLLRQQCYKTSPSIPTTCPMISTLPTTTTATYPEIPRPNFNINPLLPKTQPNNPQPQRNPSNDSAIDLGIQPPPPNHLPAQTSAPTSTQTQTHPYPHLRYNTQFLPLQSIQQQQNHQAGLLAMMYPPLDGFSAHRVQPLPSPMYGRFAVPGDNDYFPYLNADAEWESAGMVDMDLGEG